MSKRSYTMSDVARLAGVSIATVSAIVNETGRVSTKLTARVKHAMEALDYQPNHVARSLKVRRTFTVGMVIPDVTNPFFTDMMCGVEDEASKNGYSVILCNSGEDPARENLHLNMLFSRRVDGVLLGGVNPEGQHEVIRRRFPLVLVDRIPPRFRGPGVVMDNVMAAFEATSYLIGLGHTRIAIIAGNLAISTGSDRMEGFRKALQEANLSLRQEYCKAGEFLFQKACECASDLFKLKEPPTAILCCNNKMTLGLMRTAAEMGFRIPEQVSVVGFDDFDWAGSFSPRLTTIRQPAYQMGQRAMEMLCGEIQRSMEGAIESSPGLVILKSELCIRDSSGPPGLGSSACTFSRPDQVQDERMRGNAERTPLASRL